MKISDALFQELKSDMRALFLACKVRAAEVRETDVWAVLHKINFDRATEDKDFRGEARRFLPYTGRKLGWLYGDAETGNGGLNDTNITAALKAALRDLKKEEREKIDGFLFHTKNL